MKRPGAYGNRRENRGWEVVNRSDGFRGFLQGPSRWGGEFGPPEDFVRSMSCLHFRGPNGCVT
jgi:hypothetical protein